MTQTQPARLEEVSSEGVRVLTDHGAGVTVAFTDRWGGVSRPPYDDLNLAVRVGDDRADVEENRCRAARGAGFDAGGLALARQVHGSNSIEVSRGDAGVVGEADVLVARTPGVTVGMLTADCASVVLAGEAGVAVAHAGWRGVVAGAVERGIASVGPVRAAWIGPSIHACCYRVGRDVIASFEERGLPVAGTDRVDPARAAASVLAHAGVANVHVSDECTHCSDRYFSYRRDRTTGRQGAFAWISR